MRLQEKRNLTGNSQTKNARKDMNLLKQESIDLDNNIDSNRDSGSNSVNGSFFQQINKPSSSKHIKLELG